MRILMLVRSDVAHDARVVREARALAGAGHHVHVVGRDVPTGWAPPDGVTTHSIGAASGLERLRPRAGPASRRGPQAAAVRLAKWLLMPSHDRSAWRSFLEQARTHVEQRARADGRWDVVHAHDYPVLPLAAELAGAWGAHLVYDSHEWWSGRQVNQRPTPLADARQRRTERTLAGRSDVVLTVSDGVAARLRALGADPVHVVRNTFPLAEVRADLPQPPPAGRSLVYAGRIGPGRDLRSALAAASPQRPLTLIGPVDRAFVPDLRGADLGAVDPGAVGASRSGRAVRLLPVVAPDDVDQVVAAAGISLVTLEDTCENHRLALPNKLFHAVRVGVPVVAADLPEMAAVVRRHDLGELYRPGDHGSLAAAVQRVLDRYEAVRSSVLRARAALSWEVDVEVLLAAYRALDRT